MTDDDLGFTPAVDLAAMVRAKTISPVEIMAALLRRMETLEPKINAMACWDGDLAMAGAKAAEKALMSGGPLGRLHGLPVTIKDLVQTKDFNTEAGSFIQKGFRAAANAPVVTRLKQAGAANIRFACLLAAPEGLAAFHEDHKDVPSYTAAIDRGLDDHGYIRPGLGDAGDRIYGTK